MYNLPTGRLVIFTKFYLELLHGKFLKPFQPQNFFSPKFDFDNFSSIAMALSTKIFNLKQFVEEFKRVSIFLLSKRVE
jgi:hypothetical protein